MTMARKFLSVSVLGMLFLLTGCKFDKNDHEPVPSKILNSPPFRTLTDSISNLPDNYILYLKRGELLSQKNFHKIAFYDYKKAWELHPDENTALAYSANLFLSGQEQDAINFLKQCVARFPYNSEFSRRLSEAYLQAGESSAALEQYNAILTTDPANFEAWYQKGGLLARLKDTAQAISALEKAYELQPLQIFGISLANLYAETKNPRALALCDELLRKDTLQELTDALFIKGLYYSNIDRPEEALEAFDKCIKRDWKFIEAYIEKGIIQFTRKKYDDALQTFALGAKVSNTYADAYYWMGRCYEARGDKNEAVKNYERALALDMNFSEAREALEKFSKRDH